MIKKKLILFLIFILAIGSVVAYENIQIDGIETNCQYSYGDYKYSADYNLSGIESDDLKSVTFYYFEDGSIKNCTKMLYSSNDECEVSTECYYNNKTNVDYIEIVIYSNDTVIFNESKEFITSVEKTDTDTTSSESSQTYVGSVNSDKFHNLGCSHAKRIKEGNKITFSSRDNALNSGYSPCGVCHP